MRIENLYDDAPFLPPKQPQPLGKLVTERLRTPRTAVIAVIIVVSVTAVILTITRSQSAALSGADASSEQHAMLNSAESAVADEGSSSAKVFVHVVGAVNKPGVLELAADARVIDAIEAAGGSTAEADLAAINLARLVTDGEQLRVPTAAEVAAGLVVSSTAAGATGHGTSALTNLNTATSQELESLPGVGPALAGRIIDWRAANGRFSSVDDLLSVSGIGEKLLEAVRSLVAV